MNQDLLLGGGGTGFLCKKISKLVVTAHLKLCRLKTDRSPFTVVLTLTQLLLAVPKTIFHLLLLLAPLAPEFINGSSRNRAIT